MVLPTVGGRQEIGRLREASDHVLDTLRHYLPKKYEFNGLRRLVIYLGPNRDGKRLLSPVVTDGVGEFLADSFDLDGWFNAQQNEQDDRILQCIEDALVERAVEFGTDPELLRAIARVITPKGEILHEEELLAGAWVVTAGDNYRSGRWNGDTLEILDRQGRKTTEVACAPYLNR